MKKLIILSLLATWCVNSKAQYNYSNININSGNKDSNPSGFISFKNSIYFFATDSASGLELRQYQNNTVSLVADIAPGTGDGVTAPVMVVCDNELYFTAGNTTTGMELYKYDGNNPPSLIADIRTGSAGSMPIGLLEHDKKLYFAAYDSSNKYNLYVYTPSSSNLKKLTNTIGSTIKGAGSSAAVFNNKIYFVGNDSAAGGELCVYDPSSGLLSLIADLEPGITTSYPRDFKVIANKLYFVAKTAAEGGNLFVYDGTTAPVNITKTLKPGPADEIPLTSFKPFVEHNNYIYLSANNNIYKYDYVNNTFAVEQVVNSPTDKYYIYNGRLFYNKGTFSHVYDFTNPPITFKSLDPAIVAHDMEGARVVSNSIFFAADIVEVASTLHNKELCILHDTALFIGNKVAEKINSTIYPNPTTQNAYLDLELNEPKNLSVRISDIDGRTVHTIHSKLYSPGQHTISLPTANMPPGTYLCSIIDEKSAVLNSTKLIKH